MRLPWLADVLRDAGCKVREVPGWKGRGKDLAAVQGVVWHHTATGPSWSNDRVDELLRIGRADLAGPLSQLGLDRDGTFVVVADGKANHNGYGTWGNASIGIEAYNNGVGEAWPAVQIAAYDRGTAAICRHLKLAATQVRGHKETDPNRKIDPAGIDMDQARQRVASLITYRPPAKPIPPKDDDMTPEQEAKLDRVLAILDRLEDDYLTTGKGVRQVIATLDKRTDDLVTGKRPAKKA